MNGTSKLHNRIGLIGSKHPAFSSRLFDRIRIIEDARNKVAASSSWVFVSVPTEKSVEEEHLFSMLEESCQKLADWPMDIIFLLDPRLSKFQTQMQRRIKRPILDIVSITANAIKDEVDGEEIVLLESIIEQNENGFAASLKSRGLNLLPLSDTEQKALDSIVEPFTVKEETLQSDDAFEKLLGNIRAAYPKAAILLGSRALFSFPFNQACPKMIFNPFELLMNEIVRVGLEGGQTNFNTQRTLAFWKKRAKDVVEKKLGVLQSSMLTKKEEDAEKRWRIERSAVLSMLEPIFKKHHRILEPGCGTGRWSRELCRFVGEVHAFDACEEFVHFGKETQAEKPLQENIYYTTGDIHSMDCEMPYDGLFCAGLLNYLSDAELALFFKKAAKCIASGGWLFLKESIALQKRLELHGFYSEALDADYYSIYRTEAEFFEMMGDAFALKQAEVVIPPADGKPETCQKAFLFYRK